MEADNERGITPEALNERLRELKKQKKSAFAQYNAVHGAIQECEYWISLFTFQGKKQGESKRKRH